VTMRHGARPLSPAARRVTHSGTFTRGGIEMTLSRGMSERIRSGQKGLILDLQVMAGSRDALATLRARDPRSDGRPPRVLGSFRCALPAADLLGMASLDVARALARALTEAVSTAGTIREVGGAPRAPEGATGGALEGQTVLPGLEG
jgi:hypothetical protein